MLNCISTIKSVAQTIAVMFDAQQICAWYVYILINNIIFTEKMQFWLNVLFS
jgi:hypothetical protein